MRQLMPPLHGSRAEASSEMRQMCHVFRSLRLSITPSVELICSPQTLPAVDCLCYPAAVLFRNFYPDDCSLGSSTLIFCRISGRITGEGTWRRELPGGGGGGGNGD